MNRSDMYLAKGTDEKEKEHIVCRDKSGAMMGIIYCDQDIFFTGTLSLSLTSQIKIVAENFELFYNNI